MHISATIWCIVENGTVTSWALRDSSIGILAQHNKTEPIMSRVHNSWGILYLVKSESMSYIYAYRS